MTQYLKNFRYRELLVRLSLFYPISTLLTLKKEDLKTLLLNIYQNSTQDFDSIETVALQFYFDEIKKINAKKGTNFFQPLSIDLIKLNDHNKKLDWGYLFTINNAIVIPLSYLNSCVHQYLLYLRTANEVFEPTVAVKANFPDRSLIEPTVNTLFHETVHLLQRSGDVVCSRVPSTPIGLPINNCPQLCPNNEMYNFNMDWQNRSSEIYALFFNYLYRHFWQFEPICRNQLKGVSKIDEVLTFITNPDGPNFQWIAKITINNHLIYVLPSLIWNRETQQPEGVLIELQPINDKKDESRKFRLTDRVFRMNHVSNYTERFYGLKQQLYHPHEISAQLLSDFIVSDKLWGNNFSNFGFYQFLNKWILDNPVKLN